MKKRVLSLLMAVTLCFSTVPMTAFAQEADTTTEQETTGEEAASQTVPEAALEPQSDVAVYETGNSGEAITDISGGNAAIQDAERAAAVKAVQALIDALPEEVTAENAEAVGAQLAAIDEAMAALTEEQTAELDMTRFNAISEAMTAAVAVQDDGHNHENMTEWDKEDSLPDTTGSYYLTKNVTLTSTWKPENNTVLCLNGYSITMNADNSAVVDINKNTTFTLYNCGDTGMITHAMNGSTKYTGKGVVLEDGATFNMYGGTISGNNSDDQYGGGVSMKEGSAFNMYGGKITDNTCDGLGGGVFIYYSVFTMEGGEITNNSAVYGGGVCVYSGGTFTMKGGKITGNTATTKGGGVYVNSSNTTFIVSGAVQIRDNNNNGTENNVSLYSYGSPSTIEVVGKLTGSIGVTTDTTPAVNNPITIAEAAEGYTLTEEDAACIIGDVYSTYLLDGKVKLFLYAPQKHPVCGVTCNHSDDEKHTEEIWMGISSLDDIRGDGYYYLIASVALSTTWECEYNVKLCLNGHSITQKSDAEVINITSTGSLTLSDCNDSGIGNGKITHSVDKQGTGVRVSGGSFIMYGGSIANNTYTEKEYGGGGVGVSGGTFTMYDGLITGNTASNGSGVYVGTITASEMYGEAVFQMYGGTINNNKTTTDGSGGGVYVACYYTKGQSGGTYLNSAKFTMDGGTISDNTAKFGGGICTRGIFTMQDGSISGNTGDRNGGGVYTYAGTFTMQGGSISDNRTDYGGGVLIYEGTFIMQGGSISDNEVNWYGGGVYTDIRGSLIMTGGSIVNNAAINGGGVFNASRNTSSGTITVSRTANITGNEGGNVYLPRNKIITIAIEGLDSSARIGVTMESEVVEGETAIVAKVASDDQVLTENDRAAFISDNDYTTKLKDDTVIFANGEPHVHAVCGTAGCTEEGHDEEVWKCITSLNEIKEDGRYYLKNPVILGTTWTCKYNVKLCLNGKTITGPDEYATISVENGKSLDITDCQETGAITHESGKKGIGIYVQGTTILWNGAVTGNNDTSAVFVHDGSTFRMNGGSITGNKGEYSGGVLTKGTFEMNGGSITGNESSSGSVDGGGVYVSAGTFTMTGGRIAENKGNYSGGVYADSTFTMTGGEITKNSGRMGGGVYVTNCGTFTMTGGNITGNSNRSMNAGGGVYVADDGKFKLTGDGSITGNKNTSSNGGAGVYIADNGTFTMDGGDITGNVNTSSNSGAGVYVAQNGAFTINGGVITGNENRASSYSGGGVYINSGTFTMNDGKITENTSKSYGGGVYIYASYDSDQSKYVPGEFIMNGGSITGNTSEYGGGGVYVAAGSTFTMTKGKIAGNTSVGNTSLGYGGGVNVASSGTAKISGGEITGNNSTTTNDVICAGGMYVAAKGHLTVSGSVQIQNNYKNGTLKNGMYVRGDNGTECNVYLAGTGIENDGSNFATITIEEGLTEDARIGVSKSSNYLPTSGTSVKIATGATDSSLNYAGIFTSDIAEQGYVVERNGSDLYLKAHQHSWKYILSEDGTTITATCVNTDTCPKTDGGSITISRPEHEVYGDGETTAATLTEKEWIAGTGYYYVTYKKGDTILNTAPTDAGTYTASITFTGADNKTVTASVTYEIAKATPTADNFNFTVLPYNLTYDGNVKTVEVEAKSGINGMGDVTVKYYQGDTVVQEPTNAGDYTVKIDVAEGTNYKAVNDLTDSNWQFTIAAITTAPTVELNGDMTYTGQQIKPDVTVKVNDVTLVKDKDYTIAYGTNVNAGENAGTVTIKAVGNYKFEDVTKNFAIKQAERTLSFTQREVEKTYGDAKFSNELVDLQNIDGTIITYASDNTAVATVDKNTGEVTIVGAGKATITAMAAETTNYKEGTASYTLTVDKAILRIGSASVSEKTYDGTTTADVSSVSLVDRNNDPVSLTYGVNYTAAGEFLNPNAGDQKANVKVTLSEDLAKNYTLEKDTFETTAEISAMPVRLGSATAEKRVYKLNDTSVKIKELSFKDNADSIVTLTEGTDYTVTGEMADANSGENKNVTVTVKLLSGNYSFIDNDNTTTTTVTILKDIPFIEAAASQTLVKNGVAVDISGWATFDNTDEGAKLTYALEGNPTGITLTGNQLTAANAADTATEFTIKVSAASTTNFAAPADKTITVTVTEKKDADVQINGAPDSKTYGDADFTLTAAKTAPEGGTWSWTSSDSDVLEIVADGKTATATIKVKNTGTATLTASYSSDSHYGSANVTITVDVKAVTAAMIADISAQQYTGEAIEPTPAVTDGANVLTEGKDFTFSYSGNVNAGTATLTITGQGNYKGTASRDFTISSRSISGAAIVLDVESLEYNGEEQTVNIKSVTLGGKELSATDYTIVNDSNKATDANDSITLTIKGQGNYTGTATTIWKITKIDPELADFQVTPAFTAGELTLTYDGKAGSVVVEKATDTISGMGDITVKYNDSAEAPVNAGSYKVTIDVSEGGNYNAVTGMEIGTLIIEKAQAPVLEDIEESYKYTATGEKSVSVADLVVDATGYTLGEAAGDTGMIKDLSIDKSGVVSYTLTGTGEIGDTMTFPVSITSVNYETATVNVVITLMEKDAQEKLFITGDTTVVYGQTLTLGTTGGSGTGTVTYHISTELGDGAATIEGNILTAVKVGAISITATKAADADYLAAVSAPVVIIITQAASTGEPKYTVITTDGKTLADAGLTLTDSTIFPAEGTLEWIDSEGEALSEDTVVEVNKTYKWCFTPKDGNYAVLTGEVELYHVDAPVISFQPENASVKTGEKATFEVSATGTDLTYQWMIDRNDGNGFVAINGADGASYTTGVTDLDCNGFRYYCIIRNAAGSVTTDIVTLTVSENIIPTPEPSTTPIPTPEPSPTPTPESSPTPDRNAYKIIDGADSKWTQNTDGTLAIRGDGEIAKFQSVKVDGNVVDPSNYTVTEGSTIITLKADYLKTLAEGSHTFELVWTDGSASTNFTVAANTSGKDTKDDDKSDNKDSNGNNESEGNADSSGTGANNNAAAQTKSPKTGDASGIWLTLFAISLVGLAGMLFRRKKADGK